MSDAILHSRFLLRSWRTSFSKPFHDMAIYSCLTPLYFSVPSALNRICTGSGALNVLLQSLVLC